MNEHPFSPAVLALGVAPVGAYAPQDPFLAHVRAGEALAAGLGLLRRLRAGDAGPLGERLRDQYETVLDDGILAAAIEAGEAELARILRDATILALRAVGELP